MSRTPCCKDSALCRAVLGFILSSVPFRLARNHSPLSIPSYKHCKLHDQSHCIATCRAAKGPPYPNGVWVLMLQAYLSCSSEKRLNLQASIEFYYVPCNETVNSEGGICRGANTYSRVLTNITLSSLTWLWK